jgi:hypothetical protein
MFSIRRCGLPISVWLRGNDRLRGTASIFACVDSQAAALAHPPAGDEMVGKRVRVGRFFAIVNGDRELERRVQDALKTVR